MGLASINEIIDREEVLRKPVLSRAYVDFLPCVIENIKTCDLVKNAVDQLMWELGNINAKEVLVFVDAKSKIPRKALTREKRRDNLKKSYDKQLAKVHPDDLQVVQECISKRDIDRFFSFDVFYSFKSREIARIAFKRNPIINSKYIADCLSGCMQEMAKFPDRYRVETVEGEDAEYALARKIVTDNSAAAISIDNDTACLLTFNTDIGKVTYCNRSVVSSNNYKRIVVSVWKQMAIFCAYVITASDYFKGVKRIGFEKMVPVIKAMPDLEFDYLSRFESVYDRCKWFLANLICFKEIDNNSIEPFESPEVEEYLQEVYKYLTFGFDFGKSIIMELQKTQLLAWSRASHTPRWSEYSGKRDLEVANCSFSQFQNNSLFKSKRYRKWKVSDIASRIDPWFIHFLSFHQCEKCSEN